MNRQRNRKSFFSQMPFVARYVQAYFKDELVPVSNATTHIRSMIKQLDEIEAQLPKQPTKQ